MKKTLLSLFVIATLANSEMIRFPDKEVVLDTDSNLMWQDSIDAKTVQKEWDKALEYCSNLNLNGITGWKLPDKYDLEELYKKKKANLLTNVDDSFWFSEYWTSSRYSSDKAWLVFPSNGDSYANLVSWSSNIRCVKEGRTLDYKSFIDKYISKGSRKNSLILKSKKLRESNNNEILFVKTPKGNLAGTANEILFKLYYSANPFQELQKITQIQLNNYLSIPTIPEPTLPGPLNLVKDEFESKAMFAQRITQATLERETQIANIQAEYRQKVLERNQELQTRQANIENKKKEFLCENFATIMGNPVLSNPMFDAETSTMYLDVTMDNANWNKKIGIKIENLALAKALKYDISSALATLTFDYADAAFILRNIDINFQNNKLTATLNNNDFQPEKVAVTIENQKIAFNELQNPNLVDKYQVSALGYGESNSAKGLSYNDDLKPLVNNMATTPANGNKWLFAIAIEQYDEADSVTFAKNSAEAFIKASQKRFGISDRNTYALVNDKATSASIKDRLKLMLSNVKDGDTIYFYYSGHGIPDPKDDGEAYILPKDKIVDFVTQEKEFMVRNLYKQLSDSKASKVVAFVDSCFSGNTDGVSNIKGVAATRMKTKQVEFDKTKMVVITAGTSNQFSNAYKEKGHRLFTYYLTKSIIQRPTLDIDSIYKEVSLNVKDESYKMGDLKQQTPQISGNITLGL